MPCAGSNPQAEEAPGPPVDARVTRSTDSGADGEVALEEGWAYDEDDQAERYTREDWSYEQRYALDYVRDDGRLLEVEQDFDLDGTPEYRTTYTWGEDHMSSALWDVMASDDQDVLWSLSVECP